jgi:hypothetical protein
MTNKILSFLVSITIILLAVIYTPGKSLKEKTAIIQKADDVVIVANPKTPAHKMRIVFKEELSIGEFEGDENYMFGDSIYFITDDEGNFYVSDSDNNRIQKYDPEGKYLLTIGREGQGPGEFRNLSVSRFDNDNNLYITDELNRRISFFDKNGKYLKQIRMQEIHNNLYINSKGLIIATKSSQSEDDNVMRRIATYGLFDDEFNLVNELYKDEIETPMLTGIDESSLAKFLTHALSELAFRPWVRYTLANNDFIYLGYPDKYEINIYSPKGKIVRKITRDYDFLPVSKKDEEYFIEFISNSADFSNPIFTEELKKKGFQRLKFPKYKPAYQSFTLMENGWLVVIIDSVENEYTLFDIFNQEGKYIANFKSSDIALPAEGLIFEFQFFFKNGKAYAVITEEEYKFVKRYNIELQEYKGNRWVKSSIKLTQ